MRQAIARILLMFAVLAMPFGMAAPAAAAPHASPAAQMAMPHCADQRSVPDGKSGLAQCTMACAAALPAAGQVFARPVAPAAAELSVRLAKSLADLHPEIATPPPRG